VPFPLEQYIYVYMAYRVNMVIHDEELELLAQLIHVIKKNVIVWYTTDYNEESVLLDVKSVNINGNCIQLNVVNKK